MKKSLALKFIIAIAFCFLGFQILILPAFMERQTRDAKQRSKGTIGLFLDLCTALEIPMFLLEVQVLKSVNAADDIVKILKNSSSVTFGLLKSEIFVLERYRVHFETIGLKLFSTKSFHSEIRRYVSSHYFLCGTDLTVHVVVFFEKTSELVWHGEVTGVQHLSEMCNIDTQYFYTYPGLYDKIALQKLGEILVPKSLDKLLSSIPEARFMECNLTRAEEFLTRNPPDVDMESKTFQRKARQTLARAKKILDVLGTPFWLSSGTCLGWFRQCNIITYSKDVDLGIFINNYTPTLIDAFIKDGFLLTHVFGKVSDSYELSFHAGDIKLDLFFFYEADEYYWNGGTHHETGQKYKYEFPKFAMCWTVFLDLKVRVPCPPEPYIEANYGRNWSEPIRNWEWNKSPSNIKENGVWPKEEWKEVIQLY